MKDTLTELLELQPKDLAPDRRVEYPWAISKMKSPATVLDVGCADSIIQKYLLKHGFNVISVDINPEARYYKGGKELRPNFRCADCKYPPKEWKRNFDYILVISTLEHLKKDDDIIMVRSLTTCLKNGGKMFITTPHGEGWMQIGNNVERGFNKHAVNRILCPELSVASTKLFSKEEIGWDAKDIFCMELERT